jgi:hypothetical protein
MKIIGLGVGRTGTRSLKLAIEQLGFGPCHHMEEVLQNQPAQVPLWTAALNGNPDWQAIYAGYESAVDWPTAGFVHELAAAFPSAKFILTVRSPDSWVDSFSQTIYPFVTERDRIKTEMLPWIDMAARVIEKTGFVVGLDAAGLREAFDSHIEAVKATIPARQLLVYQVKDGWTPLCEFLGVPVPADPFPRTNDRSEFWELVSPALAPS